jgi:hypothetical protein
MTESQARRYLTRAELKGRIIDYCCAIAVSFGIGFMLGKALFF